MSRAQQEAEQYKRFYGETIPTKVLCDRLANFCHVFSLYWSLRPLGSAALTASFDDQGPHIYLSETNGVSYRYYGIAVGKGRQGIKTELERLKLGEMTTREALKVREGRRPSERNTPPSNRSESDQPNRTRPLPLSFFLQKGRV